MSFDQTSPGASPARTESPGADQPVTGAGRGATTPELFPVTPCPQCKAPTIRTSHGSRFEPEASTDHRALWRLEWRNGEPYALPDVDGVDEPIFTGPRKRYRLHLGQCRVNKPVGGPR